MLLPPNWFGDLDWPPQPSALEPEDGTRPPTTCRLPGTKEILCVKCNWWYYLREDDPALGRMSYRCKACERVSE